MEKTLLFIGAMLVAFQYVSDIGYVATLFSVPFILPLKPIMNKLGLYIEKSSPIKLSFKWNPPKGNSKKFIVTQVILWLIFIILVILSGVITLLTQPIMIVYFIIGRPLLGMNKLLNLLHEKFFTQCSNRYLAFSKKYFGTQTTKDQYSDEEWLEIHKKKGELPFLAFIGLLFIITGFIIQLT